MCATVAEHCEDMIYEYGVSLHDLVKTWFDIVERQLREGCIARNRIVVGSCASEVEDGRGERR